MFGEHLDDSSGKLKFFKNLIFQVNLRHKILDDFMIYPGYVPNDEDPHLLHYGLEFQVLDWNFGKSNHEKDPIVNECNKFFEAPPFPSQVTSQHIFCIVEFCEQF